MRKIIKNILTENEAEQLLRALPCNMGAEKLIDTKNPQLIKILERLKQENCYSLCDKSYAEIQFAPGGHPWHTDLGTDDHMLWCKFGGAMLMPNAGFTGGELRYNISGSIETISNRCALDMYIHTSDEKHMSEPSSGDRRSLLIFL